jgi:hypothetical protein
MEFVLGQSSSHWERLRVSSYRGFFLFPQRTIPTSMDRQGGGLLSDHPYGYNHLYSQSTDWGWFLKTYPRVRIFAYSPRTGTRSKCLPNPWGVTLMTEPDHRRRLHDAVGFFFYHDKQMHTQGYYITHSHPKSTDWCTWRSGFSFFTTTNRWIPTGITSRICTQSLRTGVHDTDEYPRVLHHAFAPKVYGMVYMTQWVFLFYHDKQMTTHGYYITHLHPKSTDWCTWRRWIPTGITSRICTQRLRTGVHDAVGFPFLPRQTNKYPRVLDIHGFNFSRP